MRHRERQIEPQPADRTRALDDIGITPRRYTVGTHRAPCPRCDRGPRDDALAVTMRAIDDMVWLCHRCGWSGGWRARGPGAERPVPAARETCPTPRRTLAPEWLRFYQYCREITPDDPAGRYLTGRCCALPQNDVRWHSECWHPRERQTFPALVALVTDIITAEPISLHMTYLAPNGSGKAPIDQPRRYLAGHSKAGGVVRLDPEKELSLGVILGEGIETCLSYRLEYGPVWAALDASNLGAFPVLPGLEGLTVLVDRDPAGEGAWAKVSARYRAAGFTDPLDLIRVEAPIGNDINDGASAP